jgi:hypothetical protein
MRGTAVVTGSVTLEPEHAKAAIDEIKCGSASHGTKATHNDIILAHRSGAALWSQSLRIPRQ